ncbi:protein LAX PANICLE 2-like [Macadamia integrifolia]|uniref:protein LAX PANICLE 2-like n=1 Tax=Macadamia integrifolia TaxID=60698 RepID=UPI001C52C16D|nr:protein LAX PANICLE 2-like [Macadamia integrifolia]
MTMVPVPTTLFDQQHYDGGGGGGAGGGGIGIGGGAFGDCFGSGGSFGHLISQISAAGGYEYGNPCSEVEACIGSDLVEVGAGRIGHNHMAEDESRTSSLNETGSSSKGGGGGGGGGGALHQEERGDEGWLQLGIGGGAGRADPNKLQDPLEHTGSTRRPGLIELDLLPPGGGTGGSGGGGSGASAQHMVNKAVLDPIFSASEFRAPRPPIAITPPPPLFLQHQYPSSIPRATSLTSLTGLSFPHQPEVAWLGYNRTYNPNPPWTPSSSPSSSATPSSSMLPVPYFARPFQHSGLDLAGPSSSSDVRVIDAPPRPHSGVWFVLQASQNQAKEPFLPQIPKTFLRIKDGRMTVRLLMKYLVNKLRLDSESEVEIRCRGQELQPFWTLQHVRDTIWRSRDAVTLNPDSSAIDHVMILQYGRSP